MRIDLLSLAPYLAWFLSGLFILALGYALLRAPWRQLSRLPLIQHAFYAALIGLCAIWLIGIEVRPQISLHLLGMALMVYVFGWCLTLIAICVAELSVWVQMGASFNGLANAGSHALMAGLLPASLVQLMLWLTYRFGVKNLFIYMLGAGFVGAAFSMLVVLFVNMLSLHVYADPKVFTWLMNFAAITPLLMFAEGFLNGCLITCLTVFKPELMKTFDDHHYLGD